MPKLYHATLSSNADSILRDGLIRGRGRPNYEISNTSVICLSSCPIVAKTFVEHADIEYDWDGESIVVFSVDRKSLDADCLSYDSNIHHDGEGTVLLLEYSKDIHPNHLTEEIEYEEEL